VAETEEPKAETPEDPEPGLEASEEGAMRALKLRLWYDRDIRIVQNLFRHSDPDMERILLVVGASHVRVLKQIMEMTPQLCPVDPLPYLKRAERARSDVNKP